MPHATCSLMCWVVRGKPRFSVPELKSSIHNDAGNLNCSEILQIILPGRDYTLGGITEHCCVTDAGKLHTQLSRDRRAYATRRRIYNGSSRALSFSSRKFSDRCRPVRPKMALLMELFDFQDFLGRMYICMRYVYVHVYIYACVCVSVYICMYLCGARRRTALRRRPILQRGR